jgi:hypothetical protein
MHAERSLDVVCGLPYDALQYIRYAEHTMWTASCNLRAFDCYCVCVCTYLLVARFDHKETCGPKALHFVSLSSTNMSAVIPRCIFVFAGAAFSWQGCTGQHRTCCGDTAATAAAEQYCKPAIASWVSVTAVGCLSKHHCCANSLLLVTVCEAATQFVQSLCICMHSLMCFLHICLMP